MSSSMVIKSHIVAQTVVHDKYELIVGLLRYIHWKHWNKATVKPGGNLSNSAIILVYELTYNSAVI